MQIQQRSLATTYSTPGVYQLIPGSCASNALKGAFTGLDPLSKGCLEHSLFGLQPENNIPQRLIALLIGPNELVKLRALQLREHFPELCLEGPISH
ncbi:hypothetical protein D3C81_1115950 [compost metagenome]